MARQEKRPAELEHQTAGGGVTDKDAPAPRTGAFGDDVAIAQSRAEEAREDGDEDEAEPVRYIVDGKTVDPDGKEVEE